MESINSYSKDTMFEKIELVSFRTKRTKLEVIESILIMSKAGFLHLTKKTLTSLQQIKESIIH